MDGNNFYHSVKTLGLPAGELHYEQFSQKLVQDREWLETRYYIGEVQQKGDLTRHIKQREFLQFLEQFNRVHYFLGRVERRPADRSAMQLSRWLKALQKRSDISVPADVVSELRKIADSRSVQYVEKAVDVMIATDMISMAYEDKYDVAYLLSADGDFTSAVQKVRETGRKVLVASATPGHEISKAANSFIPLKREFFHGCWR